MKSERALDLLLLRGKLLRAKDPHIRASLQRQLDNLLAERRPDRPTPSATAENKRVSG